MCVVGRYGSNPMQTTADSCAACIPGRYADTEGADGLDECKQCEPGRFSTAEGANSSDTCEACPAGQSQPYSGLSQCNDCARGKAQAALGQAECEECDPGLYTGFGETECTLCELGRVDHDNDARSECTNCPPGKYIDSVGRSLEGRFNGRDPGANPGGCKDCFIGRSGNVSGSVSNSSCTRCPAGKWATLPGSTVCSSCLAGGASPGEGEFRIEPWLVRDDPPGNLEAWEQCICGANGAGCIAQFLSAAPMTFGEGEYDETNPWNLGCTACVTNSDLNMNGIWCPDEGTVFPYPAQGYYMERNTAPPTTVTCQPAEACTGDFGIGGCLEGYEEVRCARCKLKYFRSGDQCLQCPGSWPLGLIAVMVLILLLILGLVADYMFDKVSRLSERVAPLLILLTFFQTVSLLLDVPLKWPPALVDFITALSFVNLNLELAKPECSLKVDFYVKQLVTLFSPLVFIAFTSVFVAVLFLKIIISHHCKKRPDGPTLGQKLAAKKKLIVGKIAGILCTALVVAAIFFLRGMVAGLDCSEMQDGRL